MIMRSVDFLRLLGYQLATLDPAKITFLAICSGRKEQARN